MERAKDVSNCAQCDKAAISKADWYVAWDRVRQITVNRCIVCSVAPLSGNQFESAGSPCFWWRDCGSFRKYCVLISLLGGVRALKWSCVSKEELMISRVVFAVVDCDLLIEYEVLGVSVSVIFTIWCLFPFLGVRSSVTFTATRPFHIWHPHQVLCLPLGLYQKLHRLYVQCFDCYCSWGSGNNVSDDCCDVCNFGHNVLAFCICYIWSGSFGNYFDLLSLRSLFPKFWFLGWVWRLFGVFLRCVYAFGSWILSFSFDNPWLYGLRFHKSDISCLCVKFHNVRVLFHCCYEKIPLLYQWWHWVYQCGMNMTVAQLGIL